MDDRVTAAVLARWLGISDVAVRDLAGRGVVVKTGRRSYTLDESVRRYCGHLRERATGRGGEAAITSATAERRGSRGRRLILPRRRAAS